MVLQIPSSESVKLNLVLEQTANGRSLASVLELPNCQVEAATDEQSLATQEQMHL